jgi:hypothetical protein
MAAHLQNNQCPALITLQKPIQATQKCTVKLRLSFFSDYDHLNNHDM